MVYSILVIVQVIVALSLVGLILVQHGKGADAGAAFGSGASGTVFGAKGSANFMSRATAALATVFFVLSLALAYLVTGASSSTGGGSVTDKLTQPSASQSVTDGAASGGGAAGKAGDASQSGSKTPATPAAGDADQNNDADSDSSPKIPE